MGLKEEILEIIEKAVEDLKTEGLQPDILLAGEGFLKYAGEVVDVLDLSVYTVKELDYDAVIADSRYLGQIRRASKRVSIEPLIVEDEMWNEIKSI
ncbi:family 4B encapsulin nanocompartment shell protein [Thermococcus sp.]|uniref:family 4B encapsulin nanocompartment shell protein n=1 Tax=Thermococcus sp. TaxID=35749 RepID=UPI0026105B7B|nr:family 4B encapsulin nanocompartment shell protein [Thermococcus sp.]